MSVAREDEVDHVAIAASVKAVIVVGRWGMRKRDLALSNQNFAEGLGVGGEIRLHRLKLLATQTHHSFAKNGI